MKTVNLQRTVTAIPDLRKKRIPQQERILIKRLRAVTAIGVHPGMSPMEDLPIQTMMIVVRDPEPARRLRSYW